MREIPDDVIPQDYGPGRCPWGCEPWMERIEDWDGGGGVYRCSMCENEHIVMPSEEEEQRGLF